MKTFKPVDLKKVRTSSLKDRKSLVEREKLGWITVPEIAPDVNHTAPRLSLFGRRLEYHPANGDPLEYFYFENHQQLSPFDDVTRNQGDNGLWILHQQIAQEIAAAAQYQAVICDRSCWTTTPIWCTASAGAGSTMRWSASGMGSRTTSYTPAIFCRSSFPNNPV
jgi:hypothetical protein